MTMRVALVYKRYADTGGSERQVAMLCRALASRGDDVHLFCARVDGRVPDGTRVHRMPSLPAGRTLGLLRFSAWARRAIRRVSARSGPFDVSHAFGRTVGQDIYRLGGGCHRTFLERAYGLDRPAWLRAVLRRHPYQVLKARLEERIFESCEAPRILTNSAMTRNDLVFRYGLDAAQIQVVPNGVDLQRFTPPTAAERELIRREFGWHPNDEIALFLGTGFARKGLDPTLRAVSRLAHHRPGLRLVVVGRDRHVARWRALSVDLAIDERVQFLGARDDPERVFRGADVFVLPTAYDPAANATLEALASGLPVITSAGNGAAEILTPGVHGTIVPVPVHPGDVAEALVRWLDRPGGDQVRRDTRSRAQDFPIEASCEAMLTVYAEFTQERGQTR